MALDIDEDLRNKIARFMDSVREFAPEARWVRPESLHVTIKFIGERSDEQVKQIQSSLRTIEAAGIEINICGYGFFPAASAPRVFWIGIEAGPPLPYLAAMVDEKLATIQIPKEAHAYNPHLTLARGSGGSGSPRWRKGDGPSRSFQRLQEKLSAMPSVEFGKMTACQFFLYQSQLSAGGSKYTKLASFPLHNARTQ